MCRTHFNPRSPHGERQAQGIYFFQLARFQSTLPARGATWVSVDKVLPLNNFNPRSPHGERPFRARTILHARRISIHAPRTGSDASRRREEVQHGHFNPRSPHGERPMCASRLFWKRHFNPRSPHGERRHRRVFFVYGCPFQSTLPARGATPPSFAWNPNN